MAVLGVDKGQELMSIGSRRSSVGEVSAGTMAASAESDGILGTSFDLFR